MEDTTLDNQPIDKQAIRILFLAADPSDAARLHLGLELQKIRDQLDGNKNFELKDHQAVKPDDVIRAIIKYKPHIVHFAGHGLNTGELCFQDETSNSKPIAPEALAELFKLVKDYVKCVIVNTCYSEKQANAIAQFVPVVIGTKKDITDNAAIKFSTGFYTSLNPDISPNSLKSAYDLGCVSIKFDGSMQPNLMPVLILGSPEIRFSSEVDAALSTVQFQEGLVFQIMIKGLTLTGKKFGLSDEVVNNIINDKITKIKKYNQSVTEYETCLTNILRDEFPLSNAAFSALTLLQTGLGLSNETVTAINNKILSNPNLDSSQSWYDRGLGQSDIKNYAKAIEYFSKAIDKDAENFNAYSGRGDCYRINELYDLAIADFTQVIDNAKKVERSTLNHAYLNRGYAFYTWGKKEKKSELVTQAKSDWSESIKMNSRDAMAYYNRALANEYFEDYASAIDDYEKSFALDTDDGKEATARRLEFCCIKLDKTEDANKWKQQYSNLVAKNHLEPAS